MTKNKEKGWEVMQVSWALDFKSSKIYIAISVKKELNEIDWSVHG